MSNDRLHNRGDTKVLGLTIPIMAFPSEAHFLFVSSILFVFANRRPSRKKVKDCGIVPGFFKKSSLGGYVSVLYT